MIGSRVGAKIGSMLGARVGAGTDEIAPQGGLAILIVGQSNAKGIGDYSGIAVNPTVPVYGGEDPAQTYETPYGSVTLYSKTYTNPALAGLINIGPVPLQPYDVAGNVNTGPELSLGRLWNIYGPGKPLKLIKYAAGGTSLGDWTTGGLAANAVAYANSVLGGYTMIGVVLDQGEADATDATLSANWAANMTTVMTTFRNAWGAVPLAFKRLSSHGTQTFNATVRTQQASYASGDANSVMVDTDDVLLQSDNLHYYTRGYQLVGDRLGAALLSKTYPLSPASTTQPYWVGSDAAAITYTANGVNQATVNWWGGTLAGDVGILRVVGTKRNQVPLALVTASGFTQIGTFQSTDGTDHVWVTLYWCRADSSTMSSNQGRMPSVVLANSNHNNWGRIDVYRNCVSTGTPYDAVASAVNNVYGTSVAFPSAITTQANQLVAMMAHGSTASSSGNRLPSVTNAGLSSVTLQMSGNPDTATTTAGEDYVVNSLATGTIGAAGSVSAGSATYPQSTMQANCIITLLGTSSGSAPSMAGVSKDATSNVYCPANSSEWATALAAAGITSGGPFALWLLQEASGNAADSIGSFTGTAGNTPSYQNVDTGWTRKSVGMADASNSNFASTSASLADPASNSYLCLMYAAVVGTPGAFPRSMGRIGSGVNGTIEPKVGTGPVTQIQAGATSYNGTSNPVSGNGFRPWVIQHNVTSSVQRLFTDQEQVNATSFAALSGKEIRIGRTVNALSAPMHVNYCAWFSGAAAEISAQQIRKLLSVLNWTPQWI